METRRMTMAQALVSFLKNQYVERDGQQHKFFAGVLGIFGHGNVAGGEQRGAENDGTHGVFVGGDARPLVVVGHEAKIVAGDEGIESDGCARGTAQLRGRAIGLHVESDMEFRCAAGKIVLTDLGTERAQLIHFEQLHMSAEGDGDEGYVGHDV